MIIPKHKVAVLGGGISGLVSAYRLLRQGSEVTLFEAKDELGGLGGTFEHEGHVMEQFYHVMLNTDAHLLGLLKDFGMSEQIRWQETKMGFLFDDTLYPFNTPLDLLSFGGLPLPARIRTAIGAAYIAKMKNDPTGLDGISAAEWLEEIFGAEVFHCLWRPLLRAKFGDLYESVPAYWFWTRLRREKGQAKEVKGYVDGGYRAIADRLALEIYKLGGKIRLRTAVFAVHDTPEEVRIQAEGQWEAFDAVISTLPLPQLRKIARGRLELEMPQKDLVYQGVVNAVAILNRRLQPNYWNAIVKRKYPFQGLVETTHVVPTSQTGGRHLVYLMNYCHRDSEQYHETDANIRFQAMKCLRDFNPKFSHDWIDTIKVFRAPFVEPVWPLGYKDAKPKCRVADTRVYLATTAQSYPDVNSWNTMVGIASETTARLHWDLNHIYRKKPVHAEVSAAQLVAVA